LGFLEVICALRGLSQWARIRLPRPGFPGGGALHPAGSSPPAVSLAGSPAAFQALSPEGRNAALHSKGWSTGSTGAPGKEGGSSTNTHSLSGTNFPAWRPRLCLIFASKGPLSPFDGPQWLK
jgi:hypothetical protein